MQSSAEHYEAQKRVRYARAEILARRYCRTSISLFYNLTDGSTKHLAGNRASRPKPQRKKTSYSQSSDGDPQKTHGSSGEDLATQEVDVKTHSWHRTNHSAWHAQSGNSSHPHQRYPSGPTGDIDPLTPVSQTSGPLRPTNETKRGGHGDWSRGCAGWRQRSYSGSEQSDVFYSNHSNHRGRGHWHPSNEVDGNTGRGRVRGRGSGRQGLTHREPVGGGQSPTSSSNSYRPVSCLVDTPGGQSLQQIKNGRIYSKSFSSDPPPGFDLPIHEKHASEALFTTTCQKENVFIDGSHSITSHHVNNNNCLKSSAQANAKQSMIQPCNWYYIDLFKCIQGPFTNQQMTTWLAGGYLPLALKIRRDCDECFLSLADHMNLAGRIPFWTGYNQPPITNVNLSTLSALQYSINNSSQISTHSTIVATQISSSTPPGITNDNTDCITLLPQSTLTTFSGDPTQLQNRRDINAIDGDKTQVTIDKHSITPHISSKLSSSLIDNSESQTIDNPSSFTGINEKALLDLYNEAQNVALHTSKIEAERLALANKLAEINSTTAKLLSNLRPTQLSSTLTESLIRTTNAVQIELARILEPCNSSSGNINNSSLIDNENTAAITPKTTTDRSNDNDDATTPILDDHSNSNSTIVVSSTKLPPTLSFSGIKLAETLSTTPTALNNMHQHEIHSIDKQQISMDEKLNTNDYSDVNDNEPLLDLTIINQECNHSQHTNNDAYDDLNNVDNKKIQSIEEPISECEIALPLTSNNVNHEQKTITTTTKKSRRKNKKTHKKLASDEIRQLAWETEFNRRKAVALEQSLAEEARFKKLAEEEAAAIAAERALAVQEKNRTLVEQRKREISRLKVDSELALLKLPESARWAATATNNTKIAVKTGPIDLKSIQASQAAEEVKRKYHDALMSEQVAVLIAAEAAPLSSKTPLTWSQVAKSDGTPSAAINPCISNNDKLTERSKHNVVKSSSDNHHHNDPIQKFIVHSSDSNNTSSLTQLDYLKINSSSKTPLKNDNNINNNNNKLSNNLVLSHSSITSAAPSTSVLCTPKVNNTIHNSITTTTKTPSIWDLPVTNNLENTNNATGKKSSSKKKKKNREVSLFPAKEELAHWCESQLSSIPLSGVDLPTLVDLLCELQATDEIVEFIETSLGRSKRISQFS
ncbi:unnamed protein product, partial [Schistosoma turkestanicum]